MPEVYQDKRDLWHIKHIGVEGIPDVISHKSPFEGQTVIIPINGEPFEFKAALVWAFHGKPCEGQSRKVSGYGYPRGESGERSKA